MAILYRLKSTSIIWAILCLSYMDHIIWYFIENSVLLAEFDRQEFLARRHQYKVKPNNNQFYKDDFSFYEQLDPNPNLDDLPTLICSHYFRILNWSTIDAKLDQLNTFPEATITNKSLWCFHSIHSFSKISIFCIDDRKWDSKFSIIK